MGVYVANRVARSIMRRARDGRPRVTVLGVTFKENVPDIRNTRVVDIVRELEDFGIAVQVHDPMADGDLLREEYEPVADAARLSCSRPTRSCWRSPIAPIAKRLEAGEAACSSPTGGFVADVPALLDRESAPPGVTLWRL